ncbi:glycosyltransferase [Lactiplantibacillus plantarum]|uniref:glycosyltransferase n=1 Tax=Lactiplantibacillus plantarum TaxID=1590 RepID=UPI003F535F20
MKKNISVAIATYNGAKYIEQQLESISKQSVSVNEIVIVDDNSSDNTVEIITNCKDKYNLPIRLYKNNSNLGYKKNFRKAISLVSGDFIFLSDQDDIWKREKVELMIHLFRERNYKLIATGFEFINKDSRPIVNLSKFKKTPLVGYQNWDGKVSNISLDRLIWGNFCPGSTYCFTRDIRKDYLKIKNLEISHDFQLFLIAANKNGAAFINKPLISYRIHEDNAVGASINRGIRKKNIYPRLAVLLNQINENTKIKNIYIYIILLFLRIPYLAAVFKRTFKLNFTI